MIHRTAHELAYDVSSGLTETSTYKVNVRQNLRAPYEFRQPPDRKIVLDLAASAATGRLFGTLGTCIHDLRRQLAVTRVELGLATPRPDQINGPADDRRALAHRTALLRDLARKSEHLRECEAAVLVLTRGAWGDRLTISRCPRCHHQAPALGSWQYDQSLLLHGRTGADFSAAVLQSQVARRDRLVREHHRGSMLCSGTGEVVP